MDEATRARQTWVNAAERIDLRLGRAERHLGRLHREISAYDAAWHTNFEEVSARTCPRGLPLREVRILKPPDPAWEIELSAALHMWRSALDHCVALAAELNGHDRDGDRRRQFPIFDSEADYLRRPQGRQSAETRRDVHLTGTPAEFREVVDSLQPFAGGDPLHHPLHVLSDLSNADKHRNSQTVGLTLRRAVVWFNAGGMSHEYTSDGVAADHVTAERTYDVNDPTWTLDIWPLFPEELVDLLAGDLAAAESLKASTEIGVNFGGKYLPLVLPHVRDYVRFEAVPRMLLTCRPG